MITLYLKFSDSFRRRFHTTANLTGVTIAASARDSAGTTRPLGVTLIDLDQRLFEVWGPAAPADPLPVGRHAVDIKYSRDGQVHRTDTFFLQIRERITP